VSATWLAAPSAFNLIRSLLVQQITGAVRWRSVSRWKPQAMQQF
jgi:hypothetical protein